MQNYRFSCDFPRFQPRNEIFIGQAKKSAGKAVYHSSFI
jgi:hypothetical protein